MTADTDGVEVETSALLAHARAVDAVADAVGLGQDAARRMQLGTGAYGQLCRALPAMIEPLHDQADRVLTEARAAMEASALSLRTVARSYDATDADAAARLAAPRSGPPPLGPPPMRLPW